MSKPFDPAAFRAYVAAAFPGAQIEHHPIYFGPVRLRFELGGEHPNGSGQRIEQATERAVALFDACCAGDDELVLLIKDSQIGGNQRWRSEPAGLLSSVLHGFDPYTASAETVTLDEGEYCYRQFLFPAHVRQIDRFAIFRAIANREQGRTPRLSQAVYFVNSSRNRVFYMYDDRGCVVYADAPKALQQIRMRYGAWLIAEDENQVRDD